MASCNVPDETRCPVIGGTTFNVQINNDQWRKAQARAKHHTHALKKVVDPYYEKKTVIETTARIGIMHYDESFPLGNARMYTPAPKDLRLDVLQLIELYNTS